MFTLQDLINAGLPADYTDGAGDTRFTRSLTPAENITFLTFSDPELAAFLTHQQQIRDDAEAAIASLQAFIDNPSPTNAEVLAAVKLNSRVNIRVIRVLLRLMRVVS